MEDSQDVRANRGPLAWLQSCKFHGQHSLGSTGLLYQQHLHAQARSFHVSPLSIRSAPFVLEPLTGSCVKEVCTLDYVQLGCHKR